MKHFTSFAVTHLSGAVALATSLLIGGSPGAAHAQSPEDFLVQMVCVDGNDVPVFGDPVSCPTSRRKLQVGEALPYHKVDTGGYQISDSFPIADANGLSRAVQTYFFTEDLNKDPLFPNQPFQYQPHGGYNIMGADENWVFFSGTSDPGRYWSPWWNASCQRTGWRLFPNDSSAFSYGNNNHGVATAANCPGTIATSQATLEWTQYSNFNFIVSTSDPSKNRQLDTLAGYHFARDNNGNFGDLEINFFTREYGATRWEAWTRTPPDAATIQSMNDRCPGGTHQDTFHSATYYMHDCRNWTTLVAPAGGVAWDPDGVAASNPSVRRWGVDPLYTGWNRLSNTHQSAPCNDAGWQVINSPTTVNLGTATGAPWQAGNCVRTISASATPSGAYYQQIAAPPVSASPYHFGVSAWKKTPNDQTPANLRVEVIQRDAVGGLSGHDMINASVINTPRWFEGTFTVAPTTTAIVFALYPDDANTEFAVTGAYIE